MLYGVSSKEGSFDEVDIGSLFSTDFFKNYNSTITPIEKVVQLTADEPRGIKLQHVGNEEHIYVHYAGNKGRTSVTRHRTNDLVEETSISEWVEGRAGPPLQPGGALPAVGDFFNEYRYTGTERAFDMVIDPFNQSQAYLLYFWTGNVGVMGIDNTELFDHIRASTCIHGKFKGYEQSYMYVQNSYCNALGQCEIKITKQEVIEAVRYLQNEFPLAMDIDQSGDIIAAAYTGSNPFVRLFHTENMESLVNDLESLNFNLAKTPLNPIECNKEGVDRILDGLTFWDSIDITNELTLPDITNPQRLTDIRFGPQLTILNPVADVIARGAVGVNVIVRDSEITSISCKLHKQLDNSIVDEDDEDKELVLNEDMRKTGFVLFPDGSGNKALPVCNFDELDSGKYVLVVDGVSGNKVVRAKRYFEYKKEVEKALINITIPGLEF